MGRRRRIKLPKEPVTVEVQSLAHDGRGIGQLKSGKTIFIDMALPGEVAVAQYTYKRSKFDEAKALEISNPAAERVKPPCDHFGICGGCSMQHMHTEAQLKHKQSQLFELLDHHLDTSDYEHVAALTDQASHYRRKARLGAKYVHKKQTALIGFREKRNSFIADISDCEILDERVARLLLPLRGLISDLEQRERIPQIEVACGDDNIALVFRHLDDLPETDVQKMIDFAHSNTFDLYLQSGGPDTVTKIYPEDGEQRLYYQLPEFNLKMAFHPMDFTQVNAGINIKMLSQAMQWLDPQPGERILDLFCGLGNFSLPIARSGAEVVAVEGDARMVERGYENCTLNALENVEFHAADLTEDFGSMSWAKKAFDKVLLDPPRSGALEIVEKIARLAPQRIVYVSCNPITLARDAKVLQEKGYQMQKAGAMDMFPHTAHVESMALFERLK